MHSMAGDGCNIQATYKGRTSNIRGEYTKWLQPTGAYNGRTTYSDIQVDTHVQHT